MKLTIFKAIAILAVAVVPTLIFADRVSARCRCVMLASGVLKCCDDQGGMCVTYAQGQQPPECW